MPLWITTVPLVLATTRYADMYLCACPCPIVCVCVCVHDPAHPMLCGLKLSEDYPLYHHPASEKYFLD